MVDHELISSSTLGGQEQSTTSSALFQDSLVQQCLNYYSSYNTSRLEDLATYLDTLRSLQFYGSIPYPVGWGSNNTLFCLPGLARVVMPNSASLAA